MVKYTKGPFPFIKAKGYFFRIKERSTPLLLHHRYETQPVVTRYQSNNTSQKRNSPAKRKRKNQIIRLFNLYGRSLIGSRSAIDRDDSVNEDVNPIHNGTNEEEGEAERERERGRERERERERNIIVDETWKINDRRRRFSIGSKRWFA